MCGMIGWIVDACVVERWQVKVLWKGCNILGVYGPRNCGRWAYPPWARKLKSSLTRWRNFDILYEHVVDHAVLGPVEKDGANFGGLAGDAPDNSAWRQSIFNFVRAHDPICALFKIPASLVPIACTDIHVGSQRNSNKIGHSGAASLATSVDVLIVEAHAHDAPHILSSPHEESASGVVVKSGFLRTWRCVWIW